ncbi:MAG: PAS domain S-box protein, partial [Candidatus Poribacteria bacterium]|nr:PAS domain S-box protein [Candidatus Poribacteria bacterium]
MTSAHSNDRAKPIPTTVCGDAPFDRCRAARTIVLNANGAIRRIDGEDVSTSQPFLDLIHVDDRPFAESLIARAAQNPYRPFSAEFRCCGSGWTSVTVEHQPEPPVEGTVVRFHDAPVAARSFGELYRVLMNVECFLWHGVVTKREWGLEWNTRSINEALQRQLLPLDVPEGGSYHAAVHEARTPESRERTDRFGDTAILSGKRHYGQEHELIDRYGRTRWFYENVYIEPLSEGDRWELIGVATEITGQKAVEEQLRQSEERNRMLFDAIPDMIVRMSRDTTILESRSGKNFSLRTPLEEKIGQRAVDLFPRHTTQLEAAIECALRTGESQVIHHELYMRDRMTELETRCVPGDGEEVIAVVRDISPVKRRANERETIAEISELALMDGDETFFDSVAEILARRFHFPSVAVELIDRDRREMVYIGTHGFDVVGEKPVRIPIDETLSGAVAMTGAPMVIHDAQDHRGYRHEGLRRLNVRTFLCEPLTTGKEILGAIALGDSRLRLEADELTETLRVVANFVAQCLERRRATAALTESEFRFRALYQSSTAGIAIIRLDGSIGEINPAFQRMLGYREEDVRGRSFLDLTAPPHVARDREIFRSLASGRANADSGFTELVHKDGRFVPVHVAVSVARAANGEPKHITSVACDISELKRAEQELRALYEEMERRVEDRTRELRETADRLARSNRELQDFAYITSHDLKEPLRSIGSFIELFRRRYEGEIDADADEMISYVVNGAKRMNEMITSLLDYSRVDTRGGAFTKTSA